MAVLVLGFVFVLSGGNPADGPTKATHGQALTDDSRFQTTIGELSLADLRGSKVVLYFYEGVG